MTTPHPPVFVISTGRTGSTLLQRLLNCHPDLVIWGEHHGFLSGLAGAWVAMSQLRGNLFPLESESNPGPSLLLPMLTRPDVGIEWANPYSAEDFGNLARAFISNYFSSKLKPHQSWGFKEIRYNNLPTLNAIRKLFPDGRFVFNTRDLKDVVRSKLYAFVKEQNFTKMERSTLVQTITEASQAIQEHYATYERFMEENPDLSTTVRYEDILADPLGEVSRVLTHAGLEPAGLDRDLLDQVMASVVSRTKRDDDISLLIDQIIT